MKDWKYKIALVAYYVPLTVGTILILYLNVQDILSVIRLHTEIQHLRQSIIKELEETK